MLTHGLLGDGEDGAAGKSCRELGRILPILFQMQNGGAEATAACNRVPRGSPPFHLQSTSHFPTATFVHLNSVFLKH